ncbi:MAG: PilN domain-containing protein [Candidatus Doudnabacteria bacterium]
MAEINLLQNSFKDTTNAWQRQSTIMLTVLSLILIVIGGITGVLFFLNQSTQKQIDAATAVNNDLQKNLNQQQAGLTNTKSFQAQLANLRLLLTNHVYISPLLDELSKATYIKSQDQTIDINPDGKIHLEGLVDSYADLGKMLLGLSTSTKFSNVKLLSALPSTGKKNGYVFSVDLNVTPGIFLNKNNQ